MLPPNGHIILLPPNGHIILLPEWYHLGYNVYSVQRFYGLAIYRNSIEKQIEKIQTMNLEQEVSDLKFLIEAYVIESSLDCVNQSCMRRN